MREPLAAADSAADVRFDRYAGAAAIAGAVISLVYAVAFVVLKNDLLASLALMAGGLLSAVAWFAVYRRVRTAGALAALGLLLGFAGTMGAAIHGAYDLAAVLHPPTSPGELSGIDPRGFLTFGISGLGVLLLAWAGLTVGGLPRNLLYLGLFFGVLLIVIYLGRLIVYEPTSILVLGPAALAGIIVSPLWYAWVGYLLFTGRAPS